MLNVIIVTIVHLRLNQLWTACILSFCS